MAESSSLASVTTGHRSAASASSTVIRPTEPRVISTMSVMRALRSTVSKCSGWRLAKVSNWRVSLVPREVARSADSARWREKSSGVRRQISSSSLVSSCRMLPKSCATPPVSWPRPSSFWPSSIARSARWRAASSTDRAVALSAAARAISWMWC